MKSRDNQLIWEQYHGMSPTGANAGKIYDEDEDDMYSDEEDMGMDDGMDYGDDDGGEVGVEVMSFEPIDNVEPTGEHDIMGGECHELDNAVYAEIKKLAEFSKRILEVCHEAEFEPWMQAQLVKASTYVSDVWFQLDTGIDYANTGEEHSDNIDL